MTAKTTPGPLQRLAYYYGKVLPASMNDWVTEDLVGRGAGVRMSLQLILPAAFGLSLFFLIPADLIVHLSATLPIFVPYTITAIGLNRVQRRTRLIRHGLDPRMLDRRMAADNSAAIALYEATYRNRADA